MNDNYKYNYSNYDEYYHKRRTKECSNVKRIRTIKKCVRQEQQRGENERKRGRIKFSPYRQVDHAIQAATIQRSDEQVTYTTVSYTHLDVYKRQMCNIAYRMI